VGAEGCKIKREACGAGLHDVCDNAGRELPSIDALGSPIPLPARPR
jgi:hypothetical protein